MTLTAAIATLVLVADQATKAVALQTLEGRGRIDLLGDWFGLALVHNPGASFGLGSGVTWMLSLLGVAVSVGILVCARRLTSRLWAVAAGLLLGGVVGNLVDRFVREPGVLRGHVVDFLAYADWFVGNVADIAIVGGVGLYVVATLLGVEPSATTTKETSHG